jgi:hypothetical protein
MSVGGYVGRNFYGSLSDIIGDYEKEWYGKQGAYDILYQLRDEAEQEDDEVALAAYERWEERLDNYFSSEEDDDSLQESLVDQFVRVREAAKKKSPDAERARREYEEKRRAAGKETPKQRAAIEEREFQEEQKRIKASNKRDKQRLAAEKKPKRPKPKVTESLAFDKLTPSDAKLIDSYPYEAVLAHTRKWYDESTDTAEVIEGVTRDIAEELQPEFVNSDLTDAQNAIRACLEDYILNAIDEIDNDAYDYEDE